MTLAQVVVPVCARVLGLHARSHAHVLSLSFLWYDHSDTFWCASGRAAAMISGWKAIGQPRGMEIWVGEIAAAWHSGEPGVTNRFISSFWCAEQLYL